MATTLNDIFSEKPCSERARLMAAWAKARGPQSNSEAFAIYKAHLASCPECQRQQKALALFASTTTHPEMQS